MSCDEPIIRSRDDSSCGTSLHAIWIGAQPSLWVLAQPSQSHAPSPLLCNLNHGLAKAKLTTTATPRSSSLRPPTFHEIASNHGGCPTVLSSVTEDDLDWGPCRGGGFMGFWWRIADGISRNYRHQQLPPKEERSRRRSGLRERVHPLSLSPNPSSPGEKKIAIAEPKRAAGI